MAISWSSLLNSSRPPDRSSRCYLIDARRVFASNKITCYLPSSQPCLCHLNHPRHLALGCLRVDGVSEVAADCWCQALGVCRMVSPSMVSLEMALFLLKKCIREKEKFLCKCKKRICDALKITCLSCYKSHLSGHFTFYSL